MIHIIHDFIRGSQIPIIIVRRKAENSHVIAIRVSHQKSGDLINESREIASPTTRGRAVDHVTHCLLSRDRLPSIASSDQIGISSNRVWELGVDLSE